MKFKCSFKGNPYTGPKDNDKTRKPVCKKFGGKCQGEVNCDYAKKRDRGL